MPMLGAILTPHPPVLLPEVGRGQEQEIHATDSAMRTAAEQVARWDPDVLIVASSHTIMYGDYFHIAPGRGAVGDMSAFGAPQVRIQVQYDVPLRDEIVSRAQAAGLRAGTLGQRDPALDHGVLIPLYFLRKAGVESPIVRMGLSGFSPLEHYRLGRCVAEAAEALGGGVRPALLPDDGGGTGRFGCGASAPEPRRYLRRGLCSGLVPSYR